MMAFLNAQEPAITPPDPELTIEVSPTDTSSDSPSPEEPKTTPAPVAEPQSPEVITPQPPPFVPQPHLQGELGYLPEKDRQLFTPGVDVGYVRDNPANPHRRLVQRTIMLTEETPRWGAILTFDDQLVPFTREESAALSVAKDLQKVNARAIFFANVPGVSAHDVRRILRKHQSTAARTAACQELLDSKRDIFIETMRELLRMKNTSSDGLNPFYTCEIYNHTAFHQDMKALKANSDRLALCLQGITFIEECLDEAYKAERPGWQRTRWFRFPFLHAPKKKEVKTEVIALFNKLGLLALGETQDSKDVLNLSWKKAYQSLEAAKKNKRYNPKFGGVYSSAEQPVALFHTKTWSKIRQGVLSAIPTKESGR